MKKDDVGANAAAVHLLASHPDEIVAASEEITDDRILASLFAAELKLRLKVLASAQSLAWHDLPAGEQRTYIKAASAAFGKGRES